MMEVNRPGKEVATAMAQKNVFIGRTWPAWPTKVRVSVGSADDMKKFREALVTVMA